MRLRIYAALFVLVGTLCAGVVPVVFLSTGWWVLGVGFVTGIGAAVSLYVVWLTNGDELRRQGFRW